MPRRKTAGIYFRYSSDKRMQKKHSANRQRKDLMELATKNGYTVVWCEGDRGISGDSKNKVALEKLKQLISDDQLQLDVLLVTSFDRLTRKDMLHWQEDVSFLADANIKLCIADEEGREFDLTKNTVGMELAFKSMGASDYLTRLSSSVVSGVTRKLKDETLGWGSIPFGYDRKCESAPDGTVLKSWIEPNEDIEVVKKLFREFLKTKKIISCAPILCESKTRDYGGDKVVQNGTVKVILRNTVYCGIRTWGCNSRAKHKGLRVKNTTGNPNNNRLKTATHRYDVPDLAVIELEDFEKVQHILDQNKKSHNRRPASGKYTFTGKLHCWHCGASLAAIPRKNSVSYSCPVSRFTYADKCSGGRKTLKEIEVKKYLHLCQKELFKDDQFHLNVSTSILRRMLRVMLSVKGKANRAKEIEIDSINENIKELTRLFCNAETDNEAVREAMQERIEYAKKLEDELERPDMEEEFIGRLDTLMEKFGNDAYEKINGFLRDAGGAKAAKNTNLKWDYDKMGISPSEFYLAIIGRICKGAITPANIKQYQEDGNAKCTNPKFKKKIKQAVSTLHRVGVIADIGRLPLKTRWKFKQDGKRQRLATVYYEFQGLGGGYMESPNIQIVYIPRLDKSRVFVTPCGNA